MMLWKFYTQYASKFGKLSSGQHWKRWVFIPTPKKGNAKECSNYCTIVLISHASKVMLKILQARLQKYITMNFQMFKLDLEKAEEPEIKLSTTVGSSIKLESSRKYLLLLYWLHQSLWLCGWQQTAEDSKRDGNKTTLLPPDKPACRSGSNS